MASNMQSQRQLVLPDPHLVCAGVALLAAGVAFYYFTRVDMPSFLRWITERSFDRPTLPEVAGLQSVPSFAHAASFTLLSAAWLPARSTYWLSAAIFWFVVNAGFEWLQALPAPLTNMNEAGWLANVITRYSAAGVFDVHDIVGAGVGALTGFALCWAIARSRVDSSGTDLGSE